MTDWFLKLIDPDPFEAQRKFEVLRRRLIRFFERRRLAGAEDRTQEVFTRVLKKRPDGLATYLDLIRFCFGVARNVAHEGWQEPIAIELPSEADGKVDPPDSAPNPEVELMRTERAQLIRSCLEALPREDLELLESWYLGEKGSHKEVADRLGKSANALRIRRYRVALRAREMFRQRGLR